jgi:hypothetical protein
MSRIKDLDIFLAYILPAVTYDTHGLYHLSGHTYDPYRENPCHGTRGDPYRSDRHDNPGGEEVGRLIVKMPSVELLRT